MKTSFLWVCVLHFLHFCCPLFCIVPMTSPCHIPHNSSPPAETPSSLPVGLCVLAGWHPAQLAGKPARNGAGNCWLHTFMAQPASALFLSQSQESSTDLGYLKSCPCVKSDWKWSIKRPIIKLIWMTSSEMV